jgi:hypothetical protein
MFGKFDSRSADEFVHSNWEAAFGWLFPSVLPVLGLTLSAWSLNNDEPKKGARKASTPYFRAAYIASSAYLAGVLSLILLQPLTRFSIFEIMEYSAWLLGAAQAVVIGIVGAFYLKH